MDGGVELRGGQLDDDDDDDGMESELVSMLQQWLGKENALLLHAAVDLSEQHWPVSKWQILEAGGLIRKAGNER